MKDLRGEGCGVRFTVRGHFFVFGSSGLGARRLEFWCLVLVFRVYRLGSCSKVWSAEFRVKDSGFWVLGVEFEFLGFRFRVNIFWCQGLGFGLQY